MDSRGNRGTHRLISALFFSWQTSRLVSFRPNASLICHRNSRQQRNSRSCRRPRSQSGRSLHKVCLLSSHVAPAHGTTHNGCTRRVGELLRSYRAGPLPKPFKIIPSFPAWARILALTAPEQWSPQAAHAATRIFISNMKPQQARVYLEGVVLGLVRADLEQPSTRKDARRLSPHLYEALKRALYKPAAFFKGIVFPLLDVSAMLLWSCLLMLHCRAHTGRVHAQGSRDRRVRADQGQGAATALVSRAHPPRGDGLLRCVPAPASSLPPPITNKRAQQGQPRCSSACCWTRSTRCRTRCLTRSCSTLSGSRTPTRWARFLCCGTRASSSSASATRRTSRQSRRTRCATSCARTRTRRSRTRSAASSLRRPRAASRRSRTRWMFRSDVAFPPVYDGGCTLLVVFV